MAKLLEEIGLRIGSSGPGSRRGSACSSRPRLDGRLSYPCTAGLRRHPDPPVNGPRNRTITPKIRRQADGGARFQCVHGQHRHWRTDAGGTLIADGNRARPQAKAVGTRLRHVRSDRPCNLARRPQVQAMKTTHPIPTGTDLTSTRVMAALLERLEHSTTAVDAHQYQSVVHRLSDALGQLATATECDAVLTEFSAASELYENLRYQHAGLCRSPLDSALAAERQARQWIEKARTRG